MSNRTKYILGGIAVALLGWWLLPNWLAALIVFAVVAAPVVGYLMLDESQRRRLSRLRNRGQVGR
jgi:hypothetical protein